MASSLKLKRGVSPILAAAVLVALTVVLGVALTATIMKPPETKASVQFQVSGEAYRGDNVIYLTHMGGDPAYLGEVTIKTYIPSGTYQGCEYTISSLSGVDAKLNGDDVSGDETWKAGDVLEIPFDKAFATSAYGLMAPSAGEQFIAEIYYGGQPAASCTITVQP
ncbi:MAG: hypothetical protein DRO18_05270 [Thermoprotei archaeon]|nr:MAG: hypothetical protein DRO18_05270 [Thermoprotei archaeon]